MSGSRRGVLGRRGIVFFLALIAAMVGYFGLRRWERTLARDVPPRAARSVLQSLPKGAVLVAELDLGALRTNPLTRAWLDEPRVVEGFGDIAALCGSDPLGQVERLAVAVPTGSDAGFGLVAQGKLDAGLLSTCAKKLIERRGGRTKIELDQGFTIVRDATMPDGARVAVRGDGPLFLAEPGYLAHAMRALGSAEPSLADDPEHSALRRSGGEGVFVVTAVLTPEQRLALVDELRKQGVVASPFAAVKGGALSIALSARLEVHAVAACDEARFAEPIAAQIREELKTQAATPLAKLVGYATLLERVSVETEGSEVHLRAALPAEEVLSVFRRVLALQRLMGGAANNEPRPASSGEGAPANLPALAPSAAPPN